MHKNRLLLKDLSCQVRLGCTAAERAVPQNVRFTLQLDFRRPPLATKTDQLTDTVCYAFLAKTVNGVSESRPFATIESLGQDIYDALRSRLGVDVLLTVTVHKVQPPVDGLLGGAYFICGDAE